MYKKLVISKTKNTSKTVFISLNKNQRKRILALLIKSIVNVCLLCARHSPKPCSRANDQRAQQLIEGVSSGNSGAIIILFKHCLITKPTRVPVH